MWRVTSDPLKHAEAVAWFRARLPMTKSEWLELAVSERRRAFTIAGVTQLDILTDVFNEIAAGQEAGEDLEGIKKRIQGKLEATWAGTVKRPSHRVETIIRNAHQAAYNAGRYRQMTSPAVLRARPFWLFDSVIDARTSEACLERDQQVRAAGSPWWDTNYPPLHHRCRSAVRTLTRKEAFRRGIATDEAETKPSSGFGGRPDRVFTPDLDNRPPELAKVYERKQAEKGRRILEDVRPPDRKSAEAIRAELVELNRNYAERLGKLEAEKAAAVQAYKVMARGLAPPGSSSSPLIGLREEVSTLAQAIERTVAERTQKARKLIYNPTPSAVEIVKGKGLGKSRDKGIKEGAEALGRMVPPDWKLPKVTAYGTRGGRAFARSDLAEIHLKVDEAARTVIHETAHVLEHHNPEILRAAVAFVERRTEGEAEVSMRSLFPGYGYGAEEMTRPDRFIHPYVGKLYRAGSEVRATEAVSMGLERMYEDPVQLALDDPDHFGFIWNLMGGPAYVSD